MCLAVPAQLTTVSPDGMTAAAMIGGIDEAEAQETLKALAALAAPSAAAASNDPAAPSADSEEITA